MTYPQRVMKYAQMPTEEINEKLKATYELWAEMTKNKADVRALNAVRDETEAMVDVLRARKIEGSGPVEPTEPLPPTVQAEPSPRSQPCSAGRRISGISPAAGQWQISRRYGSPRD